MMAASWAVSAGISLPIPFVNYTPQRHLTPTRCAFYNSDFLIYSSMGSFYIPCVVMLYSVRSHLSRYPAEGTVNVTQETVVVRCGGNDYAH
jgi:hypothetical protein